MWINPQYVDNHVDNYANTGVQLLITHEGFIFLMIISMVLRIESFLTTSWAIFSAPWITVVWSRLPRALPTAWSGAVVIWRHRYIAIWRGWTMSAVRLDDKRSSYLTLKWSATVWIISSGVISFFASAWKETSRKI